MCCKDFKIRLWFIFVAFSQLLNVAFVSKIKQTTPNESISGRAYRQKQVKEKYINFIFKLLRNENEHCKNAYYEDLKQAREYIRKHNEYNSET